MDLWNNTKRKTNVFFRRWLIVLEKGIDLFSYISWHFAKPWCNSYFHHIQFFWTSISHVNMMLNSVKCFFISSTCLQTFLFSVNKTKQWTSPIPPLKKAIQSIFKHIVISPCDICSQLSRRSKLLPQLHSSFVVQRFAVDRCCFAHTLVIRQVSTKFEIFEKKKGFSASLQT